MRRDQIRADGPSRYLSPLCQPRIEGDRLILVAVPGAREAVREAFRGDSTG